MLGAEIPTWLAALGLVVPALTALLTLLITNRSARKAFGREADERARVRKEELRAETWKTDRSERKELYRALVDAANNVLVVNQPIEEERLAWMAQQGYGEWKVRPTAEEIDQWAVLLTSAELTAPRIVEVARAVDDQWQLSYGARLGHQTLRDNKRKVDPEEVKSDRAMCQERVRALKKACSDDLASMIGEG
jgi:hypothetical protein